MDNWIRRFKSSKPISFDQKVIIPGEPEAEAEIDRKANGIPLTDAVANDLNGLAEKFGISKPNPKS
jgi:LDH2 family malate/lactate/ureidoglycolate dehydrogenase